jgi:hypothetical protein
MSYHIPYRLHERRHVHSWSTTTPCRFACKHGTPRSSEVHHTSRLQTWHAVLISPLPTSSRDDVLALRPPPPRCLACKHGTTSSFTVHYSHHDVVSRENVDDMGPSPTTSALRQRHTSITYQPRPRINAHSPSLSTRIQSRARACPRYNTGPIPPPALGPPRVCRLTFKRKTACSRIDNPPESTPARFFATKSETAHLRTTHHLHPFHLTSKHKTMSHIVVQRGLYIPREHIPPSIDACMCPRGRVRTIYIVKVNFVA